MSQIRRTEGTSNVPKQHEVAKKEVAKKDVETQQQLAAHRSPNADRVMSPIAAQILASRVAPQINRPAANPVRDELGKGNPALEKALKHKGALDIHAALANLDPATLNPDTRKGLQTLNFS